MPGKNIGGIDYPLVMLVDTNGVPTDPGGGGGSSVDRELVVTTYVVKTGFAGASIGDTVTLTQVLDVSGSPTTVTSLWRNQTTGLDLSPAPTASNLTLVGSTALTDAQLRAAAVAISLPARTRYTPTFERVTGPFTIAAGAVAFDVANVGAADGVLDGATLKAGETPGWDAISNGDYAAISGDATGTEFVIRKAA